MILRVGEQDIIADRDEAKRQWKSHLREANRWRDIYLAYDALARATGGNMDTASAPETIGGQNGHKPADATSPTIKELLLGIISANEGLTAHEIRAQVSAARKDVKDKYIYNLLTELTKKGVLDREEGNYYEKKQ